MVNIDLTFEVEKERNALHYLQRYVVYFFVYLCEIDTLISQDNEPVTAGKRLDIKVRSWSWTNSYRPTYQYYQWSTM